MVKTILALETSCDETAVAILRGSELLSSEIASQVAAHEKYGGVVPEIASRNHLVQAPRLLERAVEQTRIKLGDIDAFAATSGPGLASSLMIGASLAKGLAIGFRKPYLAVNHLEGHLLSPFFGEIHFQRHVALIVSGGHTLLVLVHEPGRYQLLGRTVDDAAGEAFDKVAKMLGLGYPGGPEIEQRARRGDRQRFHFPRSMPETDNFSFSGLKTAVRYLLPRIAGGLREPRKHSGLTQTPCKLDDRLLADVCASFQQAVIDVLVQKSVTAARRCGVDCVTLSGGVSCNQELRMQLEEACAENGLRCRSAAPWLSTDNAAMIAFAAWQRLEAGGTSSVTEEIDPNLALN
jgi:tRNA N6-adenosine threonylcarbamoyltransferase